MTGIDGKIYKVFVSSTYEDLREERAAVQKALLQLGCLPVGMELFPAADDETWEFIKSQIDDADYYVIIIAGKYGSIAPDGISFTEKEYDYALSKPKPAIGFVHGNPGAVMADRIEKEGDRRTKLEAFLRKVKQRPVRPYTNPHELALEVTTSFVSLIRQRPAEGYVRSSDAVDYKRYAALLEENNALKKELEAAQSSTAASDFALTQWGNLRVADNPEVVYLFQKHGPDRNKFLALLVQSYINCWARDFPETSDLRAVSPYTWNSSYFDFVSKSDSQSGRNETYICGNNSKERELRDIYLNYTQMKRIWPTMDLKAETSEMDS